MIPLREYVYVELLERVRVNAPMDDGERRDFVAHTEYLANRVTVAENDAWDAQCEAWQLYEHAKSVEYDLKKAREELDALRKQVAPTPPPCCGGTVSARLFTDDEVIRLRNRYHTEAISIRALAWEVDENPVTLKRLLYGVTYQNAGGPTGKRPPAPPRKTRFTRPGRDALRGRLHPSPWQRSAIPASNAVELYRTEKARHRAQLAPLLAAAREEFQRQIAAADPARNRRSA